MSTDHYLRINELKNAVYCLRIPFYTLCWSMDRDTKLARMGVEKEASVKQKMKRRKHALHTVHAGTRHFDVPVVYHELELVGRLDEIVETDAGLYLVDYKDTDRDYGYWKIQMAAYRLALEEAGETVQGCYVYTIPNQTYHDIRITKRERRKLAELAQQMHGLIASEICPPPTPHTGKCYSCQYANFCNDIL
jgi:CRISPR-associated protein Cas4